jgi:hypothetical protein
MELLSLQIFYFYNGRTRQNFQKYLLDCVLVGRFFHMGTQKLKAKGEEN